MLEEIEMCLAGHPRVQLATVVEQGDRLVAYAVAAPGAALDEEQLRDFLKGRLPAYKMPRYFVVLDSMPLGPQGQVDHAALPDPQAAAAATHAASAVGAGQPSERARYLADLWAELLHCEVQASDNFFDLGGHSMLAVQMANRVHRDTGVRIQLMTLATQSLAQIASTLPVLESGSATGPGLRSRLLGKFRGMLQV
ncbi:MAG: phosphopantetheine-binding protein [Pseudoxanthomonas sp.]